MQRFFLNFVECLKYYDFYFKNNGQDILNFLLKLQPNYVSDNIYLNSEWTVPVVSILSQLMSNKNDYIKKFHLTLIFDLITFMERCQNDKSMISAKWEKDIIKIQSIIITYLVYYKDDNKIVDYELTILAKTIFNESSYLFLKEQACIPIIFQFLRSNNNSIFSTAWKFVRQLFKVDLKSGIDLLNSQTFKSCFAGCIIQNDQSAIEVIYLLTKIFKKRTKKDNNVNINELLNVIKEAQLNPLEFCEHFEENVSKPSKRAIIIINQFRKMLKKSPKVHKTLQAYFV